MIKYIWQLHAGLSAELVLLIWPGMAKMNK